MQLSSAGCATLSFRLVVLMRAQAVSYLSLAEVNFGVYFSRPLREVNPEVYQGKSKLESRYFFSKHFTLPFRVQREILGGSEPKRRGGTFTRLKL